ncbi:uncharacterized protein UMAG_04499 [Mycosarcoma maydis]|uniref:Methyltransferase type 11 domain-containing protein n=1 Tax=Mycosarcoma maydis TaxID=5270 RepID=A0A0D1DST0_MYCMD|nr:uncharacterized protein UMAG_04499 [Ustilago maydis 521]KIS67399.1 hypothetical protein UMAG_04499 [Ustilago maydis 521]|eukprot:XP_011390833.1 hypothetical protein UMAG_04499 [Ustilago maydis 521]
MSESNASYTQGYSEAVLRSHASRTAETCAAFLLPHLKPDAKVLDIGCGPGTITTSLAKYIPDGSIIGTDYSAEVVAEAQKRLDRIRTEATWDAERYSAERCSFQTASVFQLPFPDDSFDIVYCHQVLMHLPQPVNALKEMRRVCKPGGIVGAREADFGDSILYPPTETFQLWLKTCEAIFCSAGAEPQAGRRLIRWAIDAGYSAGTENITYSSSNMAYGGQPHAKFWGQMWAERIAAESWKKQALDTGEATEQQIEQMHQDWLSWSDTPDGVLVIVCGEILLRK